MVGMIFFKQIGIFVCCTEFPFFCLLVFFHGFSDHLLFFLFFFLWRLGGIWDPRSILSILKSVGP
jgi:hypothetical protein